MSIGTRFASEDDPFSEHVEPFVSSLRAVGYAERTLEKKRRVVTAFAQWMRREQVSIIEADETHVTTFLQRAPQRFKRRHSVERAALGRFLEHLRATAGVAPHAPPTAHSPDAALAGRYVDYLCNERGLTERTIQVYLPFI